MVRAGRAPGLIGEPSPVGELDELEETGGAEPPPGVSLAGAGCPSRPWMHVMPRSALVGGHRDGGLRRSVRREPHRADEVARGRAYLDAVGLR